MANTLLKVSGLKVSYGGIKAVKGIDLEVNEGELITLIGSNGAGKTTTMKAITGIAGLEAGDIEYLGKNIKGKGAWDLVKQGLAMVPEGRGVFTRMTITENLQMGAYIRKDKAALRSDIERMFGIFPRLQGAQGPAGRHHERWRTADAGHGARADEPAQGAAA
jgi:branched-chain amino acid transport system ATP-binding protein